MTPPPAGAAAAAARQPKHAPTRQRPSLRPVPGRQRRPTHASGGAAGKVALPAPSGSLAQRTLRAILTLPDHRLVCRVVGGPAWIWLLGIGLGGIVFMQVSMLKMNAGIGRAVETTTNLERSNALLETSVARLSSGDRIESAATRMGMVPAPAEHTRFLRAHPSRDGARAAREMKGPGNSTVAKAPTAAPTAATPQQPAAAETPQAQAQAQTQTQTQAEAPPAQPQTPEQPADTQQPTTPQAPATTPQQQPTTTPGAAAGAPATAQSAPPTGGAAAGG